MSYYEITIKDCVIFLSLVLPYEVAKHFGQLKSSAAVFSIFSQFGLF